MLFCCYGNIDDVFVLLDDGRVAVYRFKGKSFGINILMWKYEKKILFFKKNGMLYKIFWFLWLYI